MATLLSDLRTLGVSVELRDGRLVPTGPQEALTAELERRIETERRTILDALATSTPLPENSATLQLSEFEDRARQGFRVHGRRPTPDEVEAAASIEHRVAWLERVREQLYRGDVTACIAPGGALVVSARYCC